MKDSTFSTNKKPLYVFLGLLGCLCVYSPPSLATDGRLTIRGLSDSHAYADVDALLPLRKNCNSLFYLDGQAKYGYDVDWFTGLGLGYRNLQGCTIFGGNIFLDYTKSENHHEYWIVSPGLEAIGSCLDFRVSGYIPVSDHRKGEGSFFPSGDNSCGIGGDCGFVELTGHQEFEHRFLRFEEVGPGVDTSVGLNIPLLTCINLRGGAYYYHMRDVSDVKGLAARIDIPITRNWAITSEASYDNEERGAVAVGLRFQLGHTPKPGCCPTLCDRFYDPIYRHVGPIDQGTGIPVVRGIKDEGLFLRRDNIYFFSETGSAVLGDPTAGTFENPFASDQFSDATVAAIGASANFYFNTGRYAIDPLGDTRVTLATGQSLYGRSNDFRCTAVGSSRPVLDGGLDIIGTGGHVIDSIILENRVVGSPPPVTPVVALSLADAEVDICNSVIHAESIVPGDNATTNAVLGIVANDSIVTFNDSTVEAIALVGGTNTGINSAIAIGNFDGDFSNNLFFINNSIVQASATVLGLNDEELFGANVATGIGVMASLAAVDFSNNQFVINCSTISGFAQVLGVNDGSNFANAIGNTVLDGATANFINNHFSISNSNLIATASVPEDDNDEENFVTGIGNNISGGTSIFTANNFLITNSNISVSSAIESQELFSYTTGIGNNMFDLGSTGDFSNNNFSLIDTEINVNSRQEINLATQSNAVGIGNSIAFIGTGSGIFAGNNFDILNSSINVFTNVIGDSGVNTAIGIGDSVVGTGVGDFTDNNFSISHSLINVTSSVNNNLFINMVNGIGNISLIPVMLSNDFAGNSFSIIDSNINALANVVNDNTILGNFAVGIGINETLPGVTDFTSNSFIINNSSIVVQANVGGVNSESNTAIVIGNNFGEFFTANSFQINCCYLEANAITAFNESLNTAFGIRAFNDGNVVNLADSILNVTALVENNLGDNLAVGLSAGGSSIITASNSVINVAALTNAEVNNAVGQEGNVVNDNSIFTVVERP